MSGRPKIKVYEYQTDGKFVKTHESMNDMRREHWSKDKGQRPLFKNGNYTYPFVKLPNGNIVVEERIGRDAVKTMVKRANSPWIDDSKDNRYIQVLNMDMKVIATFKNINIATKMTNIPQGTIYNSLESTKNNIGKTGLTFRYKKFNG